MHELPLIVFQIDYSKCPIQLPPVPPAHHLPMRVLAQMRHRRLGETAGHGHSNLSGTSPHIPTARIYSVGVDSSWYTAGIMHELPLIVFQIDYSKCPIQLPPVPPAHHLPMRVLAQMRHRRLGETGGHGHSNLHLEPTLASWHPRMARPRALAQASVERPRDEASPATSWRPAGASQLLPPATLLHSIGLLRQA